jgi:DNA-directed RNA polymerase subunit RPC12/RpoP
MSLLTVKVFSTSTDANLFKSKLESNGIDCYLFDENINSMNMLYGVATGGIKAKVNAIDTEKVKQVLQQIEEEKRAKDIFIKCPVCESTKHYKNFTSIKGWKAFLAAIVAFLTFTYPVYQKTVYKCKECDAEFELEEAKQIKKIE